MPDQPLVGRHARVDFLVGEEDLVFVVRVPLLVGVVRVVFHVAPFLRGAFKAVRVPSPVLSLHDGVPTLWGCVCNRRVGGHVVRFFPFVMFHFESFRLEIARLSFASRSAALHGAASAAPAAAEGSGSRRTEGSRFVCRGRRRHFYFSRRRRRGAAAACHAGGRGV